MTALLASVVNADEALLALGAGADIIDLKNPAAGALGALPLADIRQIVAAVDGRCRVSATVGDLPMQADLIARAAADTAACGVDMVKVGFFGHDDHLACIDALQPLADSGVGLVAVLFADQAPDFDLLPALQQAGFYGVMLDTAAKDGGSLPDYLDPHQLSHFVALARHHSLYSGLAGALRAGHVRQLADLNPDYLGFRGALCESLERTAHIDADRLTSLRALLRKRNISAGIRAAA